MPKYLPLLLLFLACLQEMKAQAFQELKLFDVAQAKQAVAVDVSHFYVINNSLITKHDKKDGKQVAEIDGRKLGFTHLNSGVVIDGKLYCANSNFPDHPMLSSVEIFDTRSLSHIGSHSFGIDPRGSLTWVDFHDGHWWAVFAQYSGKNASEGKDNRWTTLVRLNKEWQQTGAWVFPKNVIERFGMHSNSGGNWSADGTLYCTGHDHGEIYELKIPQAGYTLEYIRTIEARAIEGQGIALDRTVKGKVILYGIQRSSNKVSVSELR